MMHSSLRISLAAVIVALTVLTQTTCSEPESVFCDTGVICPANRLCAKNQAACLPVESTCGDGVVDEGEQCDNGTIRNGRDCSAECTFPVCGDGKIYQVWDLEKNTYVSTEVCDHGCKTQEEWIGNNHDCRKVDEKGEEIKDENKINCAWDCSTNYSCGDGVINPGEVCDIEDNTHEGWGERDGGWYCSPNCLSDGTCGNGYVDTNFGEECEDSIDFPPGTPVNAKCISCKLIFCGNGEIEESEGEECDPGRVIVGFDEKENPIYEVQNTRNCTRECNFSRCGDGIINSLAGEECEVNNQDDFSETGWEGVDINKESAYCNSNCKVNTHTDGFVNVAAGELCEPNGETAGRGIDQNYNEVACNSNFQINKCGDGIKNDFAREECDAEGINEKEEVQKIEDKDGDETKTIYCTPECKISKCGDEYLDKYNEECESGGVDTKDCWGSECKISTCGDEHVNEAAGEVCDKGENTVIDEILMFEEYIERNCEDTNGCPTRALQEKSYKNYLMVKGSEAELPTPGLHTLCYNCLEQPFCGNGELERGEVCDRGINNGVKDNSGEFCSEDCLSTGLCGNGTLDTAIQETCDDPGKEDCTFECKKNSCGDGYVYGEECDSAEKNTQECVAATCKISICGDGVVNEAGSITPRSSMEALVLEEEFCDDGDGKNILIEEILSFEEYIKGEEIKNKARASQEKSYREYLKGFGYKNGLHEKCYRCSIRPVCGNGKTEVGEVCDKGSANGMIDDTGTFCSPDCLSTGLCGNGRVDTEVGEGCDTPLENNCNEQCMGETCGNGKVEGNEYCDTGNLYPDNNSTCVIDFDVKNCDERSWRWLEYVYELSSECSAEDIVDEADCDTTNKVEGQVCCRTPKCLIENIYDVCVMNGAIIEENICSNEENFFVEIDGRKAFERSDNINCEGGTKKEVCIVKACKLAVCGDGYILNHEDLPSNMWEECDLGQKNGTGEIVDGYACTKACKKLEKVSLSTEATPSETGSFKCKVLQDNNDSCEGIDENSYGICEEKYSLNATVCIKALPNNLGGHEFLSENNTSGCPGSSWSEEGGCIVNMGTEDKRVYANFTKQPVLTTSFTEEGGTLESCDGSALSTQYTTGTEVQVCAKPNAIHFMNTGVGCPGDGWTEIPDGSGRYKCTVVMNGDRQVKATFIDQPRIEYSANCNPPLEAECGSMSAMADEITVQSGDQVTTGKDVVVTAIPPENYELLEDNNKNSCPNSTWAVDEKGIGICSLQMGTRNVDVRPLFTKKPKLTATKTEGGTWVSCEPPNAEEMVNETSYYASFKEVSVCVKPAVTHSMNTSLGCPGASWLETSAESGIYTCTVTMNGDQNIQAIFERIEILNLVVTNDGGNRDNLQCKKGRTGSREYSCTTSDKSDATDCTSQYELEHREQGKNKGYDHLCVFANDSGTKIFIKDGSVCPGGHWSADNICTINYGTTGQVKATFIDQPKLIYSVSCNPQSETCSEADVISASADGKNVSSQDSVQKDARVVVTVKPPTNYELLTAYNEYTCPNGLWQNNNGNHTCTFTMGINNVSVTPLLTRKPMVTATKSAVGGNWVSCESPYNSTTVNETTYYSSFSTVSICARVLAGYNMSNIDTGCNAGPWTILNENVYQCQIENIDADKLIHASFSSNPTTNVTIQVDEGTSVQCSSKTVNNDVSYQCEESDATASCGENYELGSVYYPGFLGIGAYTSYKYLCMKATDSETKLFDASESTCPGGSWISSSKGVYVCTVAYNAVGIAKAVFKDVPRLTYAKACSDSGNSCGTLTGTVTSGAQVTAGTSVTLSATPSENYELLNVYNTSCPAEGGWTKNEDNSNYTCTWSMGTTETAVNVLFTKKPQLNINLIPSSGGEIVQCDTETPAIVNGAYYPTSETPVSVCVKATADYQFDATNHCNGQEWQELENGVYKCAVTMNGNQTLSPSFSSTANTVFVTQSGSGTKTCQIVDEDENRSVIDECVKAQSEGFEPCQESYPLLSGKILCVKGAGVENEREHTELNLAMSSCAGKVMADELCQVTYSNPSETQAVSLIFTTKPQLKLNLGKGATAIACSNQGTATTAGYYAAGSPLSLCISIDPDYEFNSEIGCSIEGRWQSIDETANSHQCDITMTQDIVIQAILTPVAAAKTTVSINQVGPGTIQCADINTNEIDSCSDASIVFANCKSTYEVFEDHKLCVKATSETETELNTTLTNCPGEQSNLNGGICTVPYAGSSSKSVVMVFTAMPMLTLVAPANSWTLYKSTCAEATVNNETESLSHQTGTTLCVKQRDLANKRFDETQGCNNGAWSKSGSDSGYSCEINLSASKTVSLIYNSTATLTLTVSGGVYDEYGVAAASCAAAGDAFHSIESPATYPVGQQLCIKAPASDKTNQTMLDASKGCLWSSKDEGYYYCDVTVSAEGASVTMTVLSWPTLTNSASATVKKGACNVEGETVTFTENNSALISPETTLCAVVAVINAEGNTLDTANSVCPEGNWTIDETEATCTFTMGTTDTEISVSYAATAPEQKTLNVSTIPDTILNSYTIADGACNEATQFNEPSETHTYTDDSSSSKCIKANNAVENYTFDEKQGCNGGEWSSFGSGGNEFWGCTVSLSENTTVVLSYTPWPTLTVSVTDDVQSAYTIAHKACDASLTDSDFSAPETNHSRKYTSGTQLCIKASTDIEGYTFNEEQGCNGGEWSSFGSGGNEFWGCTVSLSENTTVTLNYTASSTP